MGAKNARHEITVRELGASRPVVVVATPLPARLLVRVRATTVDRTDCAALRGKPLATRVVTGLARPKHQVLGTEFAGRIEAVGVDVTDFSVSDEVFGFNEATFNVPMSARLWCRHRSATGTRRVAQGVTRVRRRITVSNSP